MFRNYFAAALRNLERNSLYASVTIAGLAIGFAVAMLIALFVRDEYSYDRFISGYRQVYRVSETMLSPGERPLESDVTPGMLAPALKLDFPQAQYTARMMGASFPPTVQRGDFSSAESNFAWADPDFFRVMPMPTIAGDLAASLDPPDGIVLTRTVARKYFGRDAPLGETVLVDKHPMRVSAVIEDLPSNTHLTADIFASGRSPYSALTHEDKIDTPFNNVLSTYVRLRPGASVASIEPQLPGFVSRHYHYDPSSLGGMVVKAVLHLVPLAAVHLRPSTSAAFNAKPAGDTTVIAAIAGVGVLVVLVAAINFITLMTARAGRRAVEVGVRKAAGASRSDLVVQFMGEAFLYVLLAVVVAIAMGELLLPVFNALLQRHMTFDYASDPALAAGIAAAAVLVALLAGAYPAFVLASFRPAAVLKGGLPQTTGGVAVRQALVIVQFAVLIGLVLGAVTIARQTWYALNEGMRLHKEQVLFIATSPCTDRLRDAIIAVPGVQDAACASAMALNIGTINDEMTVDGRRALLGYAPVDFRFFDVYGVAPLAGRLFDRSRPGDAFVAGAEVNPPVVINETAVKKLGFRSPQAALGHSIAWHFHPDLNSAFGRDPARPSQIIGVVPDFTFGSMRSPIAPTLYLIGPKVSYYAIALNAKLDGRRIPEALRGIDRVWKRMEGEAPIQRTFVTLFTLRLYIDTLVQGALITIAAVVALSIAALGLFALSAYTTERRTKEIGIRKAMGADTGDILRLLIWQFTKPVLWANLVAWPVSFLVLTGWLGGFAYHVDPAPWTFAAAAGAALFIAWATVFVHALRVARAKPVGALRYE